MIPAPTGAKRQAAFFDTECFPNYWLLRILLPNGDVLGFWLREGQRFTQQQIDTMRGILDSYTMVSFNGIQYDYWMCGHAFGGANPAELKWLNDKMIVEKEKPWTLNVLRWEPADGIDIMNVLPGAGGQKQYAGRIHCRKMQDLPYSPDQVLTDEQIQNVFDYCGNDLDVLRELYLAARPLLELREGLSERYGIDLRSKSDAQLAEAVLKKQCERALGVRIYKQEVDWLEEFYFEPPEYLQFQLPQLRDALRIARETSFGMGPGANVEARGAIEGLEIAIGATTYVMGLGGLHSKDGSVARHSSETHLLRDLDVASYYPSLILNSGKWPPALGQVFLSEFRKLKDDRLAAKARQAELKKAGDTSSAEYLAAKTMNEGGKIMINGTFGKTGNAFGVLFAPSMMIRTTLSGQFALLMLVERHEMAGIPVVSANTDGIVIHCRRDMLATSEAIVKQWERDTNLEMEATEYRSVYQADVNNYIAIKDDGSVKRKGKKFAVAGLTEKKNPDVEICAEAVADFLASGKPILTTILECTDVRKFVKIQKVDGGGIKLWGEGALKTDQVRRDMEPRLLAAGWIKDGRKWSKDGATMDAKSAYMLTFQPQRAEPLGKVVRWYYSTQAPGPIVYANQNKTVGRSHGARPCMVLPDELPEDIDYGWYFEEAMAMLKDVGYFRLSA